MQTPFVILRRKVIYLIKKVFPFTLMAKNRDYNVLLFLCVATLRINLPNLCPNMIHDDSLDFSE